MYFFFSFSIAFTHLQFAGNNLTTLCGDNLFRYYDIVGNQLLYSVQLTDNPTASIVSPTDDNLVAISAEDVFRLVDLRSSQVTMTFQSNKNLTGYFCTCNKM